MAVANRIGASEPWRLTGRQENDHFYLVEDRRIFMDFNPQTYGPVVAELLAIPHPYAIVPKTVVSAARPLLENLSLESLFPGKTVAHRDMAECCISGLWLLFDFLDKSHTISQDIHTKSGSYWHGIMHRREPDWSNAKYWFRQVGDHPIFPALANESAQLISQRNAVAQAMFLTEGNPWDAFRFVDLCEGVCGRGEASEAIVRDVALLEWQLLFDFCYRQAL